MTEEIRPPLDTDGAGGAAPETAAPPAPAQRQGASLNFRIIRNLRAGIGQEALFDTVLAELTAAGHRYEVRVTRKAGDAADFVRAARRDTVDAVVIAGGDGTFNDALQGAGPETPVLALLPIGTANVLAHEIGLPPDAAGIAACLIQRRTVAVRPGVVNGRRFICMVSVGLDAQVVADLPRALKKRLGKAAYVVQAARTLWRSGCPPLHLRVDAERDLASTVIVNRGSRYGGRYVLAPDAALTQDRLHVTAFPMGWRLGVFARLAAIPSGLIHRVNLVRRSTGTEIEITGLPGTPVQADGDIVTSLPARISLDPLTIRLCVGGAEAAPGPW